MALSLRDAYAKYLFGFAVGKKATKGAKKGTKSTKKKIIRRPRDYFERFGLSDEPITKEELNKTIPIMHRDHTSWHLQTVLQSSPLTVTPSGQEKNVIVSKCHSIHIIFGM